MKKCPKCGKIYDDSLGGCLTCGVKLEEKADSEERNKNTVKTRYIIKKVDKNGRHLDSRIVTREGRGHLQKDQAKINPESIMLKIFGNIKSWVSGFKK